MSKNFENFNEKFIINDLIILETEYWRWSVRPIQCTAGAGVLSLKRAAETMSELTEKEGADLINITKIIESTLKKAFHAEKMNYIMLMMVDFHVHYHVVPRYSSDIVFAEHVFKDLGWPKPPVLDANPVNKDTLIAIRDYLKANL